MSITAPGMIRVEAWNANQLISITIYGDVSMKRRYTAAFSVLAVMATHAHAQSTVTLYGIIDLGLQYTNSAQTARVGGVPQGASQLALTDAHSTGLTGSRWGLKGAEDLGGGLKAMFTLEKGLLGQHGRTRAGRRRVRTSSVCWSFEPVGNSDRGSAIRSACQLCAAVRRVGDVRRLHGITSRRSG